MDTMKTLLTASLLAVATTAANAETIYSHTFSDVTTPALNGTTVEFGAGALASSTWTAGFVFQSDGSVNVGGRRTSALLPFAITEGEIYELTVSMTVVGASNQFLGLGFANNNAFVGGTQNDSNDFRLAANETTDFLAGYAWMFAAPGPTGALAAFDGDGTGNPVDLGTNTAPNTPTLKIVLDASDSVNWTTTYYVDDVEVGASSQAKALYANINSVGLTVGNASGSFSDFSLAVVPEASSLALLGLGGLCVLRRRRN